MPLCNTFSWDDQNGRWNIGSQEYVYNMSSLKRKSCIGIQSGRRKNAKKLWCLGHEDTEVPRTCYQHRSKLPLILWVWWVKRSDGEQTALVGKGQTLSSNRANVGETKQQYGILSLVNPRILPVKGPLNSRNAKLMRIEHIVFYYLL